MSIFEPDFSGLRNVRKIVYSTGMFGRRKTFSREIRKSAIDPDEVLLDAFNLPSFDTNQF